MWIESVIVDVESWSWACGGLKRWLCLRKIGLLRRKLFFAWGGGDCDVCYYEDVWRNFSVRGVWITKLIILHSCTIWNGRLRKKIATPSSLPLSQRYPLVSFDALEEDYIRCVISVHPGWLLAIYTNIASREQSLFHISTHIHPTPPPPSPIPNNPCITK